MGGPPNNGNKWGCTLLPRNGKKWGGHPPLNSWKHKKIIFIRFSRGSPTHDFPFLIAVDFQSLGSKILQDPQTPQTCPRPVLALITRGHDDPELFPPSGASPISNVPQWRQVLARDRKCRQSKKRRWDDMDMDRKVKRRWHVRCRANKKIPVTAKKYRSLSDQNSLSHSV